MFIVYLWYIYPIFIVYLSYVVDKERVRFFISLVEKYYTKFTCNVLFGNIIYQTDVKRNIISVAPTALFFLWGSFIRGLHPCLCYFVPPGLCFSKIFMNYQEYSLFCLCYFVPLGLCFVKFLWTTKNTLHSACFISFLWDFVLQFQLSWRRTGIRC